MDAPTTITLTPTPQISVTRSQVSTDVAFQVGAFYAIIADYSDYCDGFCIAKCVKTNVNSFSGLYLENCSETEDFVFFRELKDVGRFESDSVHSILISIIPVENCKGSHQNIKRV